MAIFNSYVSLPEGISMYLPFLDTLIQPPIKAAPVAIQIQISDFRLHRRRLLRLLHPRAPGLQFLVPDQAKKKN
jgi:hypothetical protein